MSERIAYPTCHCIDVEPGTYANQVSMLAPFDQPHRDDRWVCIDTCITTLIGWLWHHDVHTLNSCCGHGKMTGWVIVDEASDPLMESFGFQYEEAPSGAKAWQLGPGPGAPVDPGDTIRLLHETEED